MKTTGKIKFWDDKKGYGFITPDSGKKEIVVHIKEFENRRFRPEIGKSLTYELSTGRDGRLYAKNAKLAEKPPKEISKSVLLAVIFLVSISIAVFFHKLPSSTIFIYTILSIITYLMYAKDKSAVENGNWRTPKTLYIFFQFLEVGLGLLSLKKSYDINLHNNPFALFSGLRH